MNSFITLHDTNNIQLNNIFKREFVKPKSSALKILSYAIWDQASKGDHTNEVTINRGSTEYINYILYIYSYYNI